MKELYKEVRENVNFELDEEELQKVIKYCKTCRAIAYDNLPLIVIGFAVTLYCISVDIYWVLLFFLLYLIILNIWKRSYQKKYAMYLLGLANDDCNVAKALTAFVTMIKYTKRKKTLVIILGNIGSFLFYMGKFEECQKVTGLLDKYYDTPVSKAYVLSLRAMMALYRKDKGLVEKCIKDFETLMSQCSERYISDAYKVVARYPAIMDAEESGDYVKMTELLQTDDEKDVTLKKVTANYRLYKVAKTAGLEEKAERHRTYVLEKGGETFYKKELECIA